MQAQYRSKLVFARVDNLQAMDIRSKAGLGEQNGIVDHGVIGFVPWRLEGVSAVEPDLVLSQYWPVSAEDPALLSARPLLRRMMIEGRTKRSLDNPRFQLTRHGLPEAVDSPDPNHVKCTRPSPSDAFV